MSKDLPKQCNSCGGMGCGTPCEYGDSDITTKVDDMSDLLPCPFCGGEVRNCGIGNKDPKDDHTCHMIACDTCSMVYDSNADHVIDVSTFQELNREMAKAWNTRVDIKCASPNCDCAIKCNKQLAQNEKLD